RGQKTVSPRRRVSPSPRQMLFRRRVDAIDAASIDDDHTLAEREVIRQSRLALEQREVFIAAEGERRFRFACIRLELRVRPHAVAQVKGLTAHAANGGRWLVSLNAHCLLLLTITLAL